VNNTSYASPGPWLGRSSTEITEIDGKPFPPTRDYRRDPACRRVSEEYFSALSIPLVRGRTFRNGETGPAPPVVISESMARQYWPNQMPIGRTFRTTALLCEVVGVCRDLQSVAIMQNDGPFYYAPLEMATAKPAAMMVRVSGDPQNSVNSIRDAIRQLDPQMAATVMPLSQPVRRQGDALKPVLVHGTLAASLALLLALSGVYGVVSFSVSQRIPEIGIRIALGAQRRDVLALVLRSGLGAVCGGLVIGIGLALAATAGTRLILPGSDSGDPVVFGAVPLFLLFAAVGAIWIPARRAAALDPVTSLRHE